MKKKMIAFGLALLISVFGLPFSIWNPITVSLFVSAENSSQDESSPIELNTTYEDSLLSSNDVNWYTFTTTTDGSVTIDFTREVFGDTTKYWKLTVYHFDENLKEISSTGFDGNHTVSATEDIGLSAGKYYIAIERYPYNFSERLYSFSVKFTSSDNWEKELNNTFQTATAINMNEGYSAALSSSDDYDWYTFSVPADGYISIDFDREVFNDTTTYWKSTIYRIDGSVEEMASWGYDGNHTKSTSPEIGLSAGRYYIKVERYPYNHSSRTYTITVNYSATKYWEKEFNSTFQTASAVNLNTNYHGSLYSSSDVDWYKFSTNINGYVSIDFEREVFYDTTTYWKLTVYKLDESLEEMASWTYDGNHAKTSTAAIGLPPGNYYFEIERYPYNYSAETYTVRVKFNASEYWEKEFNNTFQTATPINTNRNYSGSMYSSGDHDWYEFELRQNITVDFDFTTGLIGDNTNHWKLHLYQRTDTIDELNSWNISGASSVTAISDLQLDAGIYYLEVEYYAYNYNPTTYQLIVNDGTEIENIIGDVDGSGRNELQQRIQRGSPEVVRRDWREKSSSPARLEILHTRRLAQQTQGTAECPQADR